MQNTESRHRKQLRPGNGKGLSALNEWTLRWWLVRRLGS
jgi:hypothetical protein